ncbi:MAG: hypothetical protein R6V55_12555 [Desulfovermiculus sp.]
MLTLSPPERKTAEQIMEDDMDPKYTAIVRKSGLEYLGVCLELNLVAQGSDLPEVEKNLRDAIESYLEDISESPETVVEPMPIQEFIEFLNDTEPEPRAESSGNFILRPLEIHEILS